MPLILTVPFRPTADPVAFDALVLGRSPRWYLKMNSLGGSPQLHDEIGIRTWSQTGSLTYGVPAVFGTGIQGSATGYITSDSESSGSGNKTYEFILKTTGSTPSGRIFQRPQHTTSPSQMGYIDYSNSTGKITWTIIRAVAGGPTFSLEHPTAINDNKFHHVVCTVNDTTRKINIYIDGIREESVAWPSGILNDVGGPNYIFVNGSGASSFFQGVLDFMVCYYFEFTPTDVANSFALTGL